MSAGPLIDPALVRLGATAATKREAIEQAGALLVAAGAIEAGYVPSLLAREEVANTCLGHGVAIPHGKIEDRHLIRRTAIAVLQLPQGIEWRAGERVHLVFAIAAQSDEHLVLLRRLTRLLQDDATLQRLYTTRDPADLLAALDQAPAAAAAPATDFAQGFDWVMSYPNGLHARPAQQWVAAARRFTASVRVRGGAEVADAKNLIGLLQLGLAHGTALHVSAEGPDADAALATLRGVMDGLLVAEQADAERARQRLEAARNRPGWRPAGTPQALPGVAASPGLATARLHVLRPAVLHVPDRPAPLPQAADALEGALAATRAELDALATTSAARLGAAEAGIFRAQATLLDDAELLALAGQLLAEGHGVGWAWHQATSRLADRLAAQHNALLAARAVDLRDVGRRVLGHLMPDLPADSATMPPGEPLILAAADLTPSDTAALDPQQVLGLVTAQGGPNAHTAIIARTLGIPAVVATGASLLTLADGATAVLDGDGGVLYLNPSADDLASAQAWRTRQKAIADEQAAAAQAPALTRDGQRIEVVANANRPDQAATAVAAGAEGVGLMRTEFLYLERAQAPTEDEQTAIYEGMLAALAGRPLIVRTLDIGGDKQVPYLNLPHEENPFLGVRGSRLMLRRPDLLEAQLRAIYRASHQGPLAIMFPMITHLAEVQALRAACDAARLAVGAQPVAIGIMVEVPAAALMAEQLARHVDFFSIGTNDLTQYVLAIDRQHPELAAEADALHPAVLRAIAQTVQGAAAHPPCWVGVCGGLAGEPLGAAILAGLGVKELSMSARDIAGVKALLRRHDLTDLQRLAQDALQCTDADAVRTLAERLA